MRNTLAHALKTEAPSRPADRVLSTSFWRSEVEADRVAEVTPLRAREVQLRLPFPAASVVVLRPRRP